MHKRIWLFTLLAILSFAGAVNAQAQTNIEIALNSGTNGYDVVFNALSPGSVQFITTGGNCSYGSPCATGYATIPNVAFGTFEMDPLGPITIGAANLNGNGYAMTGSATFTFAIPNTNNQLVGTITFNQFNDSPTTPTLGASIQVTSVNGTLLTSLFTTGLSPSVSFGVTTINNNAGLPNGAGNIIGNGTINAAPANGSVQPPIAPAPVPEPASIAMLGTGLLALGGTIKRRYFK